MSADVPEGFVPFDIEEGFVRHSGPFYWRAEPDGGFSYGFHSEARHGNPNNVLHGAALIAFADTFLGHAVVNATGRICATVSLNTQFVSGASAGGWVTGTARIRRLTGTMAFLDADVFKDGALLMTTSAIFRVFRER
jgi:uncharacterized protein (TIGR00369 family)